MAEKSIYVTHGCMFNENRSLLSIRCYVEVILLEDNGITILSSLQNSLIASHYPDTFNILFYL